MTLTPEQIHGLRVRSGMDAFRPTKEHWQAKDDDATYRFARGVEVAARRDALEEAAVAVETATYRNRWLKAEVNGHPGDVTPCELAELIRDMKGDTQ